MAVRFPGVLGAGLFAFTNLVCTRWTIFCSALRAWAFGTMPCMRSRVMASANFCSVASDFFGRLTCLCNGGDNAPMERTNSIFLIMVLVPVRVRMGVFVVGGRCQALCLVVVDSG